MVFGRKQEASDEIQHYTLSTAAFARGEPAPEHQNGRFRQPTGIAWDSKGNSYISDGYVNSRVAKIDKNGNWVKSWGKRGKEPGEFLTPHSIAVDVKDNIYVGDRGNARVQVFDTEGNYLRQFSIEVPAPEGASAAIGNPPSQSAPRSAQSPGAPDTICITPGPTQVMYVADLYPGRVYKVSLDGRVLGMFGRSGKQLGQFGWIHELACPSENEIYTAELLNWRVQKLLLHP
jgi:DNA-binding beta-propeller fold protein YncE